MKQNEPKTIEELKEMPRSNDYESIPTIGENENWPGIIENW